MDAQRPRLATAVMFFVSGAVIGVWAANVPFVRDRLDASTTTLGLCLLAMAAGSVLTMPLAGRELQRRESRAMTRVGGLLVPLTAMLPLLAGSVPALALALFVFGASVGLIDVSMNAHGVAVERVSGRAVMSSLHAGWSFGGLAGAGATALGHALGADPRATAALFMVVLLALGLWAGPQMGEMSAADESPRTEAGAPARGRARPSRAVVVIGALVFALFMSEGALTDWSALYLDRDLGSGASLAAIGYGAFAGGMAVGRAFGDALKRAFGGVRLLRGGALLTCVSIAAMLLIGVPGVALVALLLAGLGAANGVPLLFSAAGHARDMDAGPAIATVSSAGYFGLLAGPPLLGFVADATSLPAALGIVALLTAVVALNAGRADG